MTMVDARGLSCPEPVLLTKQALADYAGGGFSVAVSSATARENVAALLTGKGLTPTISEEPDGWLITVAGT
ncbi:MAG: sulfurtransferase TusA family protein [Planctomycetes bacterium]|nr:sulfurtransferase TusA family protein [Planctomycetota bacterium]